MPEVQGRAVGQFAWANAYLFAAAKGHSLSFMQISRHAGCVMAEIPEWTAALLRGEFEPMRALVRELAESEPMFKHPDRWHSHCIYCDGKDPANAASPVNVDHLPTCLWLRARKMAGLS